MKVLRKVYKIGRDTAEKQLDKIKEYIKKGAVALSPK